MNTQVRFYVYAGILCFAVASAFVPRKTDKSFLCLKLLLILTFVAEISAHVLAVTVRNNMVAYHVFVPLQLVIIGWYYHYANPQLRKLKVGVFISILSIIAACLNTSFLQPLHSFNSNFMLFAGFCTIGMALATFYHFYVDDASVKLTTNPHFQISLIFLLYWSCTFVSYAFHEVLEDSAFRQVYVFIWSVNLISYMSLGLVFLSLKNKQVQDAR